MQDLFEITEQIAELIRQIFLSFLDFLRENYWAILLLVMIALLYSVFFRPSPRR